MDIKGVRQRLNMSQEVFGVLVGKSAKTIGKYERGLIDPPDGFESKVQELEARFTA